MRDIFAISMATSSMPSCSAEAFVDMGSNYSNFNTPVMINETVSLRRTVSLRPRLNAPCRAGFRLCQVLSSMHDYASRQSG